MGERLLIGVDGGGTKCRVRIRDEDGRLVGEGLGGPANIRVDPAAAWGSILAACRSALAAAGRPERDLAAADAGLGLAGAARQEAIDRMLALPHPFRRLAMNTDAHIAWLGAFGGAEGAILIVGTGSVGYGCLQGRPVYIGGRGFHISDDGSGAVLGRELLRRTIWAYDGRAAMTDLVRAVIERFGGNPEAMVDWSNGARPVDYASFAPLIFDHARQGDALGVELVTAAAADVGRIGARLLDLGAPRICLFGGLAEPLKPWLPRSLIEVTVEPLADALDGAIMLAQRAAEAA